MTTTSYDLGATFVMASSNEAVTVIERFSIPDAEDIAAALEAVGRHVAEQWSQRSDYAGSLLLRHRVQAFNIFSGPSNVPGIAVISRWRPAAGDPLPTEVPDGWSVTGVLPGASVIGSRTYTVDFTESVTAGDRGTPVSIAEAPIAHMGIFTRLTRGMEPLLVEARAHSKESFRAGGVTGVNFHSSVDGREAINVGQWTTTEHLETLAQQVGFGSSSSYWDGFADGFEGTFFDLVGVDPEPGRPR